MHQMKYYVIIYLVWEALPKRDKLLCNTSQSEHINNSILIHSLYSIHKPEMKSLLTMNALVLESLSLNLQQHRKLTCFHLLMAHK